MKKREKQQIRSVSTAELIKQLGGLEVLLADRLVNRYTKPAKNLHEGKFLRQKIAVLKTWLREKEIVHESKK